MPRATAPLLVFVVCALGAVLWTWPLALHPGSRLPHDPGDPILNTWILGWNARAVPFTARWWNPPVMYPVPGALALSEHLAGLTPLAAPVQLLGGSPVLAYNLCFLASYALSGWFAYLLVRRLTGSPLAAACGGLAFATAPYRAGQLGHLQVLSAQWLPALLLGLHGYLESGRRRWLWLAAAAWVLNGLTNGYYLLFTPVLVALWLAWFVDWRRAPRRGLVLAGTLAVASLALVPALVEYRAVHTALGLTRTPEETVRFSATLPSFAHAPPLLAFWPSRPVATQEDFLFPGLTGAILVLAGLLARRPPDAGRRRPPLPFYAIAAVVLWACAFGPGAPDGGAVAFLRPYRWLALLPGFDGLRVPARFAMLATLCLSVASGLAVARLTRGPRAAVVGALALAGLAAEGWMQPMPLVPPPPRVILSSPADRPVLELPPDDTRVSVSAMYRALWHRRPLVNIYSGHIAPHYTILSHALRRGDLSPLRVLSRPHGLTVIVNGRSGSGAEFLPLVLGLPGARAEASSGAGAVVELPPAAARPARHDGAPLPRSTSDAGGERLVIDLGGAHRVEALTFALRWHYLELPERLLVERSDDGVRWNEAWRDWTGEAAFEGALEDPQLTPVRLPLDGVTTRYLRVYPAPSWLAQQVQVIGR